MTGAGLFYVWELVMGVEPRSHQTAHPELVEGLASHARLMPGRVVRQAHHERMRDLTGGVDSLSRAWERVRVRAMVLNKSTDSPYPVAALQNR